MLMENDGAQNEPPHYPKTLITAVNLIRFLDLDVLLHSVNAVGLSAFNPTESSMGPLSRDLAGVVLPHNYFGNHLNCCHQPSSTVTLFIAGQYQLGKHINYRILILFG